MQPAKFWKSRPLGHVLGVHQGNGREYIKLTNSWLLAFNHCGRDPWRGHVVESFRFGGCCLMASVYIYIYFCCQVQLCTLTAGF
jgi:hypothetical protein